MEGKPSLESCINVFDFEAIASATVPETGWVYYSSGADDEITLRENHNAFHRIWMRPRVMVNVRDIDMSTTILGHRVSMPMMMSAIAMCKLGHPEGEVAWNKAAGAEGIICRSRDCRWPDVFSVWRVGAVACSCSYLFFLFFLGGDIL